MTEKLESVVFCDKCLVHQILDWKNLLRSLVVKVTPIKHFLGKDIDIFPEN